MRLLVAAAFALVVVEAPGAESKAVGSQGVEFARALKLQVEFPEPADREAMVFLEFDLLADGTVSNIRVSDDGFHEQRFVEAAITALQKSQWRTRSVNGQPVDSFDLRLPVRFSIGNMEKGITQEFKDEASKVEDMLRSGNFAGGERHARWIQTEKVTLLYEYAILQAQLGQVYAGLGRLGDAVRMVERATARADAGPEFMQVLDNFPSNKASNYLLERDVMLKLLAFRMRLLAAQGQAVKALNSYYELHGLKKPAREDPLVVLAEQLTARVRGDEPLRARVEFGPSTGLWQPLARQEFTIESVRGGRINGLSLKCSTNSQDLEYVPGQVWAVPDGWAPCKVLVEADAGTRLEFVEYPDAR